ncbi:uncharacterized protein [Littorina saxatilis]|uniref:uncharacterized protein isoform X2 n=1 Tax=Littorina saxatilis TaxID=31220 RepID=UPI0038B5F9D5
MANGCPDSVLRRFIKLVRDGDEARKIHALVGTCSKEDFMSLTDDIGQDALHYAVLADNAEAVDYLLKLGYFAPPHEPLFNMYAHLAARLGYRDVLTTILQHRPEDFKVALQPLILPPDIRAGCSKAPGVNASREPEYAMPAVVGNQIPNTEKRISKPNMSQSRSSWGTSILNMSGMSGRNGSLPYDFLVHGRRFSQQGDSFASASHRVSAQMELEPIVHTMRRQSTADKNSRRGSLVGVPDCHDQQQPRRESLPKCQPHQSSLINYKRRNSSPEDSLMCDSTEGMKPLSCTPLEVAARYKHVECVRALLEMYVLQAHPEKGKKGYLTLATLASNSSSLRLLLHSARKLINASPSTAAVDKCKEDYRSAVGIAVCSVYPECLDTLLAEPIMDSRAVFDNANYYHVLFSQPNVTYRRLVALSRLPAMTEMLIKKGQDVNAKMPVRTYPLYTLIDNAFCCKDFTFTDNFLTCMTLILEKGADPNFDEVEHEQQLPASSRTTHHVSRLGFPSALHCVMECMEEHQETYPSRSQAVHFAEECMETLIAHGANIKQVGKLRHTAGTGEVVGDVLFQLAKSSVNVGVERGLLRCVMRFGAEPSREIKGQYALYVYLDLVCGCTCLKPVARCTHYILARHNALDVYLGEVCDCTCLKSETWQVYTLCFAGSVCPVRVPEPGMWQHLLETSIARCTHYILHGHNALYVYPGVMCDCTCLKSETRCIH